MPAKTSILYFTVALLLCTPLCTPAHAEKSTADVEISDMELFEFIADWETDDGQWLEPSDFEEKRIKGSNDGDFHMTTTKEGHYDH